MMDSDVRKSMEVLLRHAGHNEAKEADLPELWDTLHDSIEAFMVKRANQQTLESGQSRPAVQSKKKKTP
jgi:predicted transcriptional regulator